MRPRKPLLLGCFALAAMALAQENPSPNNQPPTFQAKVNLVLVPVVVRDKRGAPVRNLTKDDFRLLDNGKPQTIATFSTVDRGRSPGENGGSAVPERKAGEPERAGSAGVPSAPERYFVYLFDDVNSRFGDVVNVRAAALSHFQEGFGAGDHAAIYTISGKDSLDFTTDRDSLQSTVSKIRWGRAAGSGGMQCPDVSYYLADLVVNKADTDVLEALTYHTMECAHVRSEMARQLAFAAASRELILGARDAQLTLSALRRAVRHLSGMPGQRVVVMASPGFVARTDSANRAIGEVLELAARYDVVINALNVRGVIQAEEEADVTRSVRVSRRPPSASAPSQSWVRYRRESARADGDLMAELTEGTGGTYFRNNNSLRAGFAQTAKAPEFWYVLGFSPTEAKAQTAHHSLRVHLREEKGLNVKARREYYSWKAGPPGNATSMGELEDAMFARDERSEIPVVLQTGYSKPKDADAAKVMVTAKIDVTALGAQSAGSFDVAITFFDSDGTFAGGTAETVKFGSGAATAQPDVTLHWDFPEIRQGRYVVRLVIREPKAKAMTTINRVLLVQ